MPTLKANELSWYGCFSVDGSALVVPCCGDSLNSNTVTRCQPKNKGKHTTFSIVLTAVPAQIPRQQSAVVTRDSPVGPPVGRKETTSVSQSLCLITHSQIIPGKQNSYKHLYEVFAFRNLSPSTQKPFPHSHLAVIVQAYSSNMTCGFVQGRRVALKVLR